MLNKVKIMVNSEEKKRLLSNFLSLSVLQGANYLLPLLTLPYLVRVLGVEYYGLLAFATATITYFQIITDYGFNLTATKEVSKNRRDRDKLVEIFSSVMMIKVFFMILSFLLLTILVFSFEKFGKHSSIYFLTFGTVIGQVLFPMWFFQGMERMKYVTYLNILAKLIFTVAIFIFVKKQGDYYLVPLLTSIGFIISGIIAFVLINQQFNIRFRLQNFKTIKIYLIDGWHVFISRFYLSVYTTTNIILLGLFTNNTSVGYYSIAEKIVFSIGNLFEPIIQTIFPYLANIYKDNFNKFVGFIKRISIFFLITATCLFLIAQLAKDQIIHLITGSYSPEISNILGIFLFIIITHPFGTLFANSLIIMDKKKEFMKVMNLTIILDFILVIPAMYFFEIMGLVIAFVSLLIIHVLLLMRYLHKSIKNVKLSLNN